MFMDVWSSCHLVDESDDQWCSWQADPALPRSTTRGSALPNALYPMHGAPTRPLPVLPATRGAFPLSTTGLRQRVSMFADDVMLFFKPTELESRTCGAILDLFGNASGLSVNMSKSATIPIHCSQEEVSLVCSILGCSNNSFPCTYLGLPLTLHTISSAAPMPSG